MAVSGNASEKTLRRVHSMLTVFNKDKQQNRAQCCCLRKSRQQHPPASIRALDTTDKKQFAPVGWRRQFPGAVEALYQQYYSEKAFHYSRRASIMCLVFQIVLVVSELSRIEDWSSNYTAVIIATRGTAILTLCCHLVWAQSISHQHGVRWNQNITLGVWLVLFVAQVTVATCLSSLRTDVLFKQLPVAGLENVTSFGYSGTSGIISMYSFGVLCLFVQLAGMTSQRAFAVSAVSLLCQVSLEAALSGRQVSYEMVILAILYALISAGASYGSDLNRRRLFASLLLLNADARRSQELVNSMLPKCIVNALQAKDTKISEQPSNLPQTRIVFQPPKPAVWSPSSPPLLSPGAGRFPPNLASEQKSIARHSFRVIPHRGMFTSPKYGRAKQSWQSVRSHIPTALTAIPAPTLGSKLPGVSNPTHNQPPQIGQYSQSQVAPTGLQQLPATGFWAGLGIRARQAAFLAASWITAEADQPAEQILSGDGSAVVRLELEHEHYLESVEAAERQAHCRASVGSILEVASTGSQVFSPASSCLSHSIRSPISPESVSGRPQHFHWGAGNATGPVSVAYLYEHVSVCFVYVCGVAQLSSSCDPIQLVRALNNLYSAFDSIVRRCGAYKVMAIADMYIIVTGVPEVGDVHHGKRLLDTVAAIIQEARRPIHVLEESKLQVKVGLHCGSVAAGVIGMRTRNFHVFGDTVNFASRMCSTGQPGRIHCSKRFKEELTAEDRFIARKYSIISRGTIPVKGKGMQETFWLESKATHTRLATASVVHLEGFDEGLVDKQVALGSDSAETSCISSPHSTASRTSHSRSFLRTTLLIENMTNPQMKARRDLVSHLQTAQLHGQAKAEQAVHAAAANPSVFRLKAPEAKNLQSHHQQADHDHQNFQNLVYVSMEPQRTFSRQFLSNRLEQLYSAVLRRGVWRQFPLLSSLLFIPSAVAMLFALLQAQQASASLRIAGHSFAVCLTATVCILISAGLLAFFKNWRVDFLYMHCARLLAGASAASAVGIIVNSIALDVRLAFSSIPISLAMISVTQTVANSRSLLQIEIGLLAGWIALAVYEVIVHAVSLVEVLAASVFIVTSLAVASLMGIDKDRAGRRGFLTRLHTGTQNRQAKRVLRHMLPSPWHADSIMRGEPVVEFLQNVTVLYSDIVGYTVLSARLHPADLIRLLDRLYRSFDAHLDSLGLYKVETIGDAFVVLGGVRRIEGTAESVSANCFTQSAWKSPSMHPGLDSIAPSPAALDVAYRKADSLAFNNHLAESSAAIGADGVHSMAPGESLPEAADQQLLHPTTAVGIFGMRMLDDISECVTDLGISFNMRIGIHMGSVVGGIVGTSRPRYFMWGFDTVIGNAMESEGEEGQIMLSNTAASVLKDEGFSLDPGPTVTVQDKKIETSFIRSFQGRRIHRTGEEPPRVSLPSAQNGQLSQRLSCDTAEQFGSAVGVGFLEDELINSGYSSKDTEEGGWIPQISTPQEGIGAADSAIAQHEI